MKKILSVLIALLFVISAIPVLAQETTESAVTSEQESSLTEINESVGITPDNPLYGLKIALERIRLGLTFNRTAKTELGLKMAEQRLLEAQLMAKENKINALERAKNEHGKFLGIVKKEVEQINDNPEKAVELETKVQESLDEQQEKINKVVLLIEGLTPEQKEKLKSLLEEFRNQTDDVKVKLLERKDKSRIKLKAKLNLNDEEVEKKIEEIENKTIGDIGKIASHQVDQAEKMLELAGTQIEKAKEQNFTINDIALTLKEKAENKLNEAKKALEEKQYKLAIASARESKRISALTIASIHGIAPGEEKIDKSLEKISEKAEKIREKLEKREKVMERINENKKESEENKTEVKEQSQETSSEKTETKEVKSGY